MKYLDLLVEALDTRILVTDTLHLTFQGFWWKEAENTTFHFGFLLLFSWFGFLLSQHILRQDGIHFH